MPSSQGQTVQRESSSTGSEPARPAGPQPASGPSSAGPAAAGSGAGHSERDLDELALALFSRIRGRLRSDLIHDREAKGLTFDNV
jgi:hypothetical protein